MKGATQCVAPFSSGVRAVARPRRSGSAGRLRVRQPVHTVTAPGDTFSRRRHGACARRTAPP